MNLLGASLSKVRDFVGNMSLKHRLLKMFMTSPNTSNFEVTNSTAEIQKLKNGDQNVSLILIKKKKCKRGLR